MTTLSQLLDIIYPPRCALCGRFLSPSEKNRPPLFICDMCVQHLMPVTHPLCTVCGTPFPALRGPDHTCEKCLRSTPWYDSMRAPYLYEGPLMRAIQRFKYSSETHLASSLGGLLLSFAKTILPQPEQFVMVPVPLHKRRLRERGFNQSLLLAKLVSSGLETPLDCLTFIRKRDTKSQTGLGRKERKRNVANAFSVTPSSFFKGKKVLLIDDVITTGHTLNECSRTLKKSGVLEVMCLALARTLGD